MKEAYGFPIVSRENVYDVLADLGIMPWKKVREPMLLGNYIASDLTEDQREELRFAPRVEACFLEQPMNGKPYTGFRSVGKSWATTFALLPGNLVPIVGEYKHGADVISLAPPSGVPSKADGGSMTACATREFEEETGFRLKQITSLSNMTPLPVSSRQSTLTYFPFLGEVDESVPPGPSKLDASEHLKIVLIPVLDWVQLIRNGQVREDCSISCTALALLELGMLKLDVPQG